MADEEAGFTFVDKRRTASETPAETAPKSDPEVMSEAEESAIEESAMEADEDLEAAAGAPGTYDLIGYCINLLASQAWQKLGLLADPQTGEAQPDLADAKVAIDTVGDLAARLESAPETIISPAMRRDLHTLLNDLRLNYVSQRGQGTEPAA